MKIKRVWISGFRGYDSEIEVPIRDLSVFIGPNDVGKSTVLEALDIFFNDGKGCVKLDKEDINKKAAGEGRNLIEISVEFSNLPDELVIDASNATSLEKEYLLTRDKTLRLIKRYPSAGKAKVFIRAHHPSNPGCSDLLLKKHSELRALLDAQGLDCADRTRSAELRQSLWRAQVNLDFEEQDIEIAKIDAKAIWESLQKYLPMYVLFQSDRENSDGDNEVQDPMKSAVREILCDEGIRADLDSVAERVRIRLEQVAGATLEKLKGMNPEIAKTLSARIPGAAELKWSDVFRNVTVAGDDEIPLNKRGSGVKRLVLLNFFRAEAERRQREVAAQRIVYAIEEPETSQHPDHQRLLTLALSELSRADSTQVLMTTHSPEIVKQLRFENLLLISRRAERAVSAIEEKDLPYPSLNEVNYLAFGEASPEYHNELYGHIEVCGWLPEFVAERPTMTYRRRFRGDLREEQKTLTEYIRHQIHHPENLENRPFTSEELGESIQAMRWFLERKADAP